MKTEADASECKYMCVCECAFNRRNQLYSSVRCVCRLHASFRGCHCNPPSSRAHVSHTPCIVCGCVASCSVWSDECSCLTAVVAPSTCVKQPLHVYYTHAHHSAPTFCCSPYERLSTSIRSVTFFASKRKLPTTSSATSRQAAPAPSPTCMSAACSPASSYALTRSSLTRSYQLPRRYRSY